MNRQTFRNYSDHDEKRHRFFSQDQRHNLILLFLSLAFALILGEGVLQLFYHPQPLVSGWRARDTTDHVHQLGFRGQDIQYNEEDLVVVLLGDSQVEAATNALDRMPEQGLQRHLQQHLHGKQRVRVFSLGTDGYGQDQQLLVLQEYLRQYRADMVVLWQTPTNDIWNNMFPTHWPDNGRPKPTFWLKKGRLAGPTERLGQSLVPRLRIPALCQHIFLNTRRDDWWENRILDQYPAYQPLEQYKGSVSNEWQTRWDHDIGLMRLENLANEKSHLAIALTPRSPRMRYGLDLTRALLRAIKQDVQAQGGRLVIFLTVKGQVPHNIAEQLPRVERLNGKFYRLSSRQEQDNIADLSAGFDYLHIPVTVAKWRSKLRDGHLNEEANDQVMRDLAAELASRISADPD